MSVAVFARLNVDFIYSQIARLPEPGEEIFSRNFDMQLGGGAAVIPIILNNLGIETKLGTFLSDDMQSIIAKMLLDKLHFQCYTNFHTKDTSPVVITSVVSMSEDRAFISYCGDMTENIEKKLVADEKIYDFLKDSKICFAQTDYPDVMKKLQSEGAFLVYDTGWHEIQDVEAVLKRLKYVDLYSPNDKEAMKITSSTTPEESLEKLADYVKYPVVKLGAKGCIAYLEGKITPVKMPCSFTALDTTGAGDNFLTGVVYGIYNDMEIIDCLKMGNIFGGNSTTELGCYQANMKLNKEKIDYYRKLY